LSKFKGNISKLGKIEIGTLAPEENEHADSDSKAFYSRLPGIVEICCIQAPRWKYGWKCKKGSETKTLQALVIFGSPSATLFIAFSN
jgi:hypothetical protein